MLETAATLAIVALVILVGIWLLQRRLIYFPTAEVSPLSTALPGAREIEINTSDGLTLTGWFLPASDPSAAVLVLNGNAGNRSHRAPLAHALAERGYEVLLFDYRGYGGNPGSPSEEGLALDAEAALAALVEVATVDRVILFGESLGAAVATRLAVESAPAAVVRRQERLAMSWSRRGCSGCVGSVPPTRRKVHLWPVSSVRTSTLRTTLSTTAIRADRRR